MRVLVTGATGCVGRATCVALAAGGMEVRASARRPPPPAPRVEPLALDLSRECDFGAAVDGIDAVVHLGAVAHVIPRTKLEIEAMHRANVRATARLAAAAKHAGVNRMLFASTVAVYGVSAEGTSIDESAPCAPVSAYGQGKLEADLRWREASGVALRLSLVFGPGDRGNIATLLRAARGGRAFVLGVGTNRKSLVHASNAADRILALLSMPEASFAKLRGSARNVVDASPTQRELVDAVAVAVGRKPPRSMPLAPFLVAGAALDLAGRVIGRAPRWRDRVRKLTLSTEFDGTALDLALGYSPRVGLAAGLETQVLAMRRSP